MGIQVQGLVVLGVFILIIALIHYGSYWMAEKRFRKLREDKPNEFIEWVIPKERMNKHQKTDVLHIGGFPFITMTESKLSNAWYHDKLDYVCYLSMDGFHITKNSYLNKSSLEERGLLREKKSNPTGDDTPITIFTDIDTGHKIWFTDERLKEMENAKLNDTLYPAPKYDPRKTIPTRDGLLAKLIDKNFDGAEIHRFMQRHNLAEAVVLYPSTSEKTLAEQRESMYIKNKKNLDAAHAEIDRTAHK